jgi:chromate transporter
MLTHSKNELPTGIQAWRACHFFSHLVYITVVRKKVNHRCISVQRCLYSPARKVEEMDAPQAAEAVAAATPERAPATLWQLMRYFLRLGTLGFGGPVALVGYMQRDLVEGRKWIAEADYQEGLALAQLSPGPLAAQLAMYLGYVRFRILGATLVGLAFIWPSFLMVVALGWLYTLYGGLPWMQAVFYGVGASVIGIIAHSAYKLTTKTIGRDWLLWGIYLVMAIVTIVTQTEQVLLFLAAGVLAWLVKAPPRAFWKSSWKSKTGIMSLSPVPLAAVFAAGAAAGGTLWAVFTFFVFAGAFVFGSGLAIIPFLYGGVVQGHHWLTDRQFVDAVAVAMITPGPVVITSGFIGFLVAGFAGAYVAALGTFLPCYVFVVAAAPAFRKYGKRPAIAAFVKGVTAAAIGAITGAVVVLGQRTITDVPSLVLALVTLLLLWRWKKIPEPFIVFGAAVVGLIVYSALHR